MALHILRRRAESRVGRTRSVVFVSVSLAGLRSYTAVDVVFRPVASRDPMVVAAPSLHEPAGWDVLMECSIDANLATVAYVADTATPTAEAVQAATAYEIVERHTTGIVPGGDRWIAKLRNLR